MKVLSESLQIFALTKGPVMWGFEVFFDVNQPEHDVEQTVKLLAIWDALSM